MNYNGKSGKLTCPQCGFVGETVIENLPKPSVNVTCPKCKHVAPLYYFLLDEKYKCKNPDAAAAIDILTADFVDCINALNNMHQKYDFGCPLCNIALSINTVKERIINVFIETYMGEKAVCIAKQNCSFCNTKFAFYINSDGNSKVIDVDFDRKDHELRLEIGRLNHEISITEVEFDSADTDKKIISAERKLQALQNTKDRLEEKHADFLEKYEEKQFRWNDKVTDKYGTDGPYPY
jgi:hypothetical protein